MHDTLDFIAALDLPEAGSPPLHRHTRQAPDASEEGALVAGDSLVSFVSGLGQQAREDVLNSTLLMQLAASKLYDKARQREEWFNFYTDGLAKLGWTLSRNGMQRYQPSQSAFTVNDVALDIIESVVGGEAYSPLARRTFEALRKEPRALELFSSSSTRGNVGTFQIMPCTQSATGEVTMLMNCMQIMRNTTSTGFLFMTFQRNDIQIFRSAQTSVLNLQTYGQVREAVIAKLGQNAQRFLANLKL